MVDDESQAFFCRTYATGVVRNFAAVEAEPEVHDLLLEVGHARLRLALLHEEVVGIAEALLGPSKASIFEPG
jgi:hypothetical protein